MEGRQTPTSWKGRLWPTIPDRETARKFAHVGAYISGFVSIIGVIVAPATFWDSIVFMAIALGLRQMSRIAAVAGLVLYLCERVYLSVQSHEPVGITMSVLFTMVFINSVRATFVYHTLQTDVG